MSVTPLILYSVAIYKLYGYVYDKIYIESYLEECK